MRRREFITLLGSATAAWPFTAHADQPIENIRRIGVLFGGLSEDDSETKARINALREALAALGWIEGQNIRIDVRWSGGHLDDVRKSAADLIALTPDAILAESSGSIGPILESTRTIPIVFVNSVDPVGSGFVTSLAHPGGNATGFMQFEYRIAGKWLELLMAVAPKISQVAVIRDPRTAPGIGQFAAIQALAPNGMGLFPVNAVSAEEIERGIGSFARVPNGGLIVTSGGTAFHREIIVSLAARHRLPAIYPFRYYAIVGGLITYGPSSTDPTKRAAGYIDRILRGEKPADLPVQAPNRYELVVNLKTARALNLSIPPTLVGTADEVIE
jgi:putative tryptophan/tyrosine transport system substrate-binding protein